MNNSEIILELETGTGARSNRTQRVTAVRTAKKKFIQFFQTTAYSATVQIAGQDLSFPLLVLSGPKEQIDSLVEHAVEQFPGMIRRINRAGTVRLVD